MKTNKEMIEETVEKLEETIFIKGGKLFPSTKNEVNKILTTLLTKHEEAVVERMSEIVANSRTIEEKYGQGNRELNARVQILFDMKNKL